MCLACRQSSWPFTPKKHEQSLQLAIVCIEDQQVIDKILSHLRKKDRLPLYPDPLPETRAPPQTSMFG